MIFALQATDLIDDQIFSMTINFAEKLRSSGPIKISRNRGWNVGYSDKDESLTLQISDVDAVSSDLLHRVVSVLKIVEPFDDSRFVIIDHELFKVVWQSDHTFLNVTQSLFDERMFMSNDALRSYSFVEITQMLSRMNDSMSRYVSACSSET